MIRLLPLLLLAAACQNKDGVTSLGTTTSPSITTTADPAPVRPEARLDAVLQWPGDRTYFYAGPDYIRYDAGVGEADEGYPLDTATYWPGPALPLAAAALLDDSTALFFSGGDVVHYDVNADVALGPAQRIAAVFPGVGEAAIEAAAVTPTELLLFRGSDLVRFDWASQTAVVEPIAQGLPGVWADGVDAAFVDDTYLHVFQGEWFRTLDLDSGTVVDEGRYVFAWPGLWDPHEGTGHPTINLPDAVAALLGDNPSAEEIAARKDRVRASIVGSDYVDLSPSYPLFLASVEDYLGAWGCLLLYDPSRYVHRFRCATDTAGPHPLDIEPLQTEWIDWRNGAYHREQVSQGDFGTDAGTPLSIHRADDDVFYVNHVVGNPATGSINGGLNIQVRFTLDGEEHTLGFSHLNTKVPAYVFDAVDTGEPLPVGTAFGFIGYTGNLWIAPPPAVDAPYDGVSGGLPGSHSHIWFADDLDNHLTLTRAMREAIDFSGRYPYGGG